MLTTKVSFCHGRGLEKAGRFASRSRKCGRRFYHRDSGLLRRTWDWKCKNARKGSSPGFDSRNPASSVGSHPSLSWSCITPRYPIERSRDVVCALACKKRGYQRCIDSLIDETIRASEGRKLEEQAQLPMRCVLGLGEVCDGFGKWALQILRWCYI